MWPGSADRNSMSSLAEWTGTMPAHDWPDARDTDPLRSSRVARCSSRWCSSLRLFWGTAKLPESESVRIMKLPRRSFTTSRFGSRSRMWAVDMLDDSDAELRSARVALRLSRRSDRGLALSALCAFFFLLSASSPLSRLPPPPAGTAVSSVLWLHLTDGLLFWSSSFFRRASGEASRLGLAGLLTGLLASSSPPPLLRLAAEEDSLVRSSAD
jgi:hypothetical protein